jgi:hypothetical protein
MKKKYLTVIWCKGWRANVLHDSKIILLDGITLYGDETSNNEKSTDKTLSLLYPTIEFHREMQRKYKDVGGFWIRRNCEEPPKASLCHFIKWIDLEYPTTDKRQFVVRYMEIFNITEPTADIVTELL